MFTTARFKLTAWYLLIIMFISFFFSAIIFRMVSFEIERFANRQRLRVEGPFFQQDFLLPDIELINETKQRFLTTLGIVNGGILIISGAAAYYLAGKTLQPIQEMVDEQNRFISDSSHELRTPLASLKTAFEVNLRDRRLTLATAKQLITDSIDEVNRLQSLSDELLTLASYQKPNGHTILTAVDIKLIISEAVKKIKPLAANKSITLKCSPVNLSVLGNRHSLVDLFVILLDNAVKYSPPKTTIHIFSQSHHHHLDVSVSDQGPGIDPKDIPHLFDRFYRADSSRTQTNISGYGLGLSIAKKIADQHHASIKVDSQLNKGSTFTVKLQLAG